MVDNRMLLRQVDKFKYLGTIFMNDDNRLKIALDARIASGDAVMNKLQLLDLRRGEVRKITELVFNSVFVLLS